MEGTIVTSDRFICPNCDKAVQNYIMVYWGRLPAMREYRVGDDFDWIHRRSGELLPPFTYRKRDSHMNFGDPAIRECILLDDQNFAPERDPVCPHCAVELDGVGVHVESNHIADAKVFLRGELAGARNPDGVLSDIIEVRGDRILGRHDLINHPHRVDDQR